MSERKLPPLDTEPGTRRQRRDPHPMSALNIWAYRMSGGKIGGRFLRGAPVCLVTPRTQVGAAAYGAAALPRGRGTRRAGRLEGRHVETPGLVSEPRRESALQRRDRPREARDAARTANAEEKAALWPRLRRDVPDYDDYQSRTDREIPVGGTRSGRLSARAPASWWCIPAASSAQAMARIILCNDRSARQTGCSTWDRRSALRLRRLRWAARLLRAARRSRRTGVVDSLSDR